MIGSEFYSQNLTGALTSETLLDQRGVCGWIEQRIAFSDGSGYKIVRRLLERDEYADRILGQSA